MSKVHHTQFSISDKARSLCFIEAERMTLYQSAKRLTEDQMRIMAAANDAVAKLSLEHTVILTKLAALDEASDQLLSVDFRPKL